MQHDSCLDMSSLPVIPRGELLESLSRALTSAYRKDRYWNYIITAFGLDISNCSMRWR